MGAPRYGTADLAEADDAQRGAVHVVTEQQIRIPGAPETVADVAIGLDDAAGGGEDQGEREIGGGLGENAGRVSDRDAAPGRGDNIDVVVADGDGADHAKRARSIDKRGIDAVRQEADQGVGAGGAFHEHVVWRRYVFGPEIDFGLAR